MDYCDDDFCMKGQEFIYDEVLIDALNYNEYRDKIYELLENRPENFGAGDSNTHYTRLNIRRMERWSKTLKLLPEVESYFMSLKEKIDFLVITEPWCGDAAHVLPVIQKFTELNKNFSIKTIMRDENPDVMNNYLTNGSKSIPKVVAIQDTGKGRFELFNWGPKPKVMMDSLMEFKNGQSGLSKGEFLKNTQLWYNKDGSQSIQLELLEEMKKALS